MAVTLILVGKTPGQTQFGLDTFTEHYKTGTTADLVLTDASVPQKGDAHPSYPFMFVTDRNCQESAELSSGLDLIYTGCLAESDGAPVLPPQQQEFDTAVQSASSSRSAGGQTVTSPITVQYYAPSSNLSYISYNAPGTASAPTPIGEPVIMTITCGDATFSGASTPALIAGWFSILTVETSSSTEIVAGKFWANTARKMVIMSPFLVLLVSGGYLSMYSPGDGYTAGDILTVSSGGESATIHVISVGAVWGGGAGIMTWEQTANSFTVAYTALPASGGSGSGAAFNVFIIP
jgi:hypothetical protein